MTIIEDRAALLPFTHLAKSSHPTPAGTPPGPPPGAAARDALQPTVEQLQDSAIELFIRMININTEA